jgi:hypothetical protein
MNSELCRRCRYHPASPRILGYCSWDCYDADGERDEQEHEQPAPEPVAA